MSKLLLDKQYSEVLRLIKGQIQRARLSAIRSVNRELIHLYWNPGKTIVEKQNEFGWGKSVVERLARDLQKEFPGRSGYSAQNLWYMRQFYLAYQGEPILQQLAGEIPWWHNVLIFSKVKSAGARRYYLQASRELGWSGMCF